MSRCEPFRDGLVLCHPREKRDISVCFLGLSTYMYHRLQLLVFARRPLHLLAPRIPRCARVLTFLQHGCHKLLRSPPLHHVHSRCLSDMKSELSAIYCLCSRCASYSLANLHPYCSGTLSGSTGMIFARTHMSMCTAVSY